jgi:hypothetical protein
MTYTLPDGKCVNIRSYEGKLWLMIFANRGSLGVELTPELAKQIGCDLFNQGRRVEKAPLRRIAARSATTT